jgi:hypothetical protein
LELAAMRYLVYDVCLAASIQLAGVACVVGALGAWTAPIRRHADQPVVTA